MSPSETRAEHDATGLRFGVVASRFNEPLVKRLVTAALEVLRARGAAEADVQVRWVPGAYEWTGGKWEWTAGHWVRPAQPTASWVPGRWEAVPGGWRWEAGHCWQSFTGLNTVNIPAPSSS